MPSIPGPQSGRGHVPLSASGYFLPPLITPQSEFLFTALTSGLFQMLELAQAAFSNPNFISNRWNLLFFFFKMESFDLGLTCVSISQWFRTQKGQECDGTRPLNLNRVGNR